MTIADQIIDKHQGLIDDEICGGKIMAVVDHCSMVAELEENCVKKEESKYFTAYTFSDVSVVSVPN